MLSCITLGCHLTGDELPATFSLHIFVVQNIKDSLELVPFSHDVFF